MLSTSRLPMTVMINKRKFSDEQPTPCKKAKLAALSTPDHYDMTPVPVAFPLRRERKRADELEAYLSREPKARRIEAARDPPSSARFIRKPRSLSPRSKWMIFSCPSDSSDDDKELALSRYWERMTARHRHSIPLSPIGATSY